MQRKTFYIDWLRTLPGFGINVFTNYVIQTPSGSLYAVYIDGSSDVVYIKSTDGGLTWSTSSQISGPVTAVHHSVWYDGWSNINDNLIHITWYQNDGQSLRYKYLDTNNDTTSSLSVVFNANLNGGSNMYTSMARARGGNLYIMNQISATPPLFENFYKSTDTGSTWITASNSYSSSFADSQEQVILLPGWSNDNQDMMAFWWARSPNQIYRLLYDDSANTWSSTLISSGMTEVTNYANYKATVDIANSQNILTAWTSTAVNSSLKCWTVTESSITEKTNIITSQSGGQSTPSIGIDLNTNYWHAYYFGKSDGTQSGFSGSICRKISTDFGTTWGNEEIVADFVRIQKPYMTIPRFKGNDVIVGSTLQRTNNYYLFNNIGFFTDSSKITII